MCSRSMEVGLRPDQFSGISENFRNFPEKSEIFHLFLQAKIGPNPEVSLVWAQIWAEFGKFWEFGQIWPN